MEEKIENKGTIQYWLNASFWTMIVSYIVACFVTLESHVAIIGAMVCVSTVSTFVISIIHLHKVKDKKALAIVALVLSTLIMLGITYYAGISFNGGLA